MVKCNVNVRAVGTIAVLLALSTGCTSYRFQGRTEHVPVTQPATPFKLRLYTFESRDDMPWRSMRVAGFAGYRSTKEDITRALLEKYPALFSTSDDALPLDVRVHVSETQLSHRLLGFVVYMGTLGVLPMWDGAKEVCDIQVTVEGLDRASAGPEHIHFDSCNWMTFLSPLGWFMPRSDSAPDSESRTGWGLMTVPHMDPACLKDQKETFSAAVADAIALAVSRCDPADLEQASTHYRRATDPESGR